MKPDSMGMDAFLKSRRAAIDPADAGLPPVHNRRRVPGLRREEVAQLAGISVDYYTRIEQGRAHSISDPVLDALARALRLSTDEHAYLRDLADPRFGHADAEPVVRPEIQRLLDAMDPSVPAHVVGPGLDYLAWNALGGRVAFDLEALPPDRRNAPLLVFLHPDSRDLHPDWDGVAAETVAALRADTGRYPCHPRVKGVLSELLDRSAEFRSLWEDQRVRARLSGSKRIRHPEVGELEVTYETLQLTVDVDQVLCTYTVEPGSPSETALRRLADRPREWSAA
ncbi:MULTISPECIES: helix-turn-helix transcriptional regulator [unclassified Streptomyces]|uniref:helix-turn-helix domain-containing protein n=1 Tax=unclassified Streptomyces TaxID=2593676 RepID=UPI002DDC32BD|nr:helix-turn-helix transcriptional regulator [Streptomyces sp. NBC_01775]WSB78517.1 helix-turn-helix transcriptional regulator [Streptomyces sp. NBC_01775]WSS42070.1 helix-turn-helix transcriptional regulator [Streptomyces sp. NBC_01187]